MRTLSAANLAALSAGNLVIRDFMWITVRDRTTGNPVSEGYWSDVGDVTAQVIDPSTGLPVSRSFYGVGTLIAMDAIPLVSNLTVQTVKAMFSQVSDKINDLIRLYDARQAPVEVFRGLFDPATMNMVAPAEPRFVGFIDDAPVETPEENKTGNVTFSLKSHTQELTKSNPDMRSNESQLERNATDNFYKDVNVVADWEIFWGKLSGKASSA